MATPVVPLIEIALAQTAEIERRKAMSERGETMIGAIRQSKFGKFVHPSLFRRPAEPAWHALFDNVEDGLKTVCGPDGGYFDGRSVVNMLEMLHACEEWRWTGIGSPPVRECNLVIIVNAPVILHRSLRSYSIVFTDEDKKVGAIDGPIASMIRLLELSDFILDPHFDRDAEGVVYRYPAPTTIKSGRFIDDPALWANVAMKVLQIPFDYREEFIDCYQARYILGDDAHIEATGKAVASWVSRVNVLSPLYDIPPLDFLFVDEILKSVEHGFDIVIDSSSEEGTEPSWLARLDRLVALLDDAFDRKIGLPDPRDAFERIAIETIRRNLCCYRHISIDDAQILGFAWDAWLIEQSLHRIPGSAVPIDKKILHPRERRSDVPPPGLYRSWSVPPEHSIDKSINTAVFESSAIRERHRERRKEVLSEVLGRLRQLFVFADHGRGSVDSHLPCVSEKKTVKTLLRRYFKKIEKKATESKSTTSTHHGAVGMFGSLMSIEEEMEQHRLRDLYALNHFYPAMAIVDEGSPLAIKFANYLKQGCVYFPVHMPRSMIKNLIFTGCINFAPIAEKIKEVCLIGLLGEVDFVGLMQESSSSRRSILRQYYYINESAAKTFEETAILAQKRFNDSIAMSLYNMLTDMIGSLSSQ